MFPLEARIYWVIMHKALLPTHPNRLIDASQENPPFYSSVDDWRTSSGSFVTFDLLALASDLPFCRLPSFSGLLVSCSEGIG